MKSKDLMGKLKEEIRPHMKHLDMGYVTSLFKQQGKSIESRGICKCNSGTVMEKEHKAVVLQFGET